MWKMSQKKVKGSPSFQSIKSLPVDLRSMGFSGSDRVILSDTVLENVELSRDAAEENLYVKGGIGSENDESPYYRASLDDHGDDNSAKNTPVQQSKQSHVDSKWSDTTPYTSKKVNVELFFSFLIYVCCT